MKIGLLLGTFDPPHLGHIYLANKALCDEVVDEVWIVPAWHSPWKPNATDYEIRTTMCESLTRIRGLHTSRLDGFIKSKNTAEFLRALKSLFPDNYEFIILAGSDIDFSKWTEGDWVKANFKSFVVSREELVCSSTKIRELIKNGESPLMYISSDLYDIIKDNNLYAQ